MLKANLKDNGDDTGTLTISDGRQFTLVKDMTSDNANKKCLVTLANRKIETLGVFVQYWIPNTQRWKDATEWKTHLGSTPINMD
jgi:hypothetical protein